MATARNNPTQAQPPFPTPEEMQALVGAWLESFEQTARAQDAEAMKRFFSDSAVLWGTEKGGCCDWPLRLRFEFDKPNCKVAPFGPGAMAITTWTMQPLVVGGDVKHGRVTLFFHAQPKGDKREFLCVHAHFSAKPCL